MYVPDLFYADCDMCVKLRAAEKIFELAGYDLDADEDEDEDLYASPSHSSFEVLDPHDPTLSRLATLLFRRTNDYLQGEIACGGDHYILLEEINRLAITKYTDLRNLAVNLNRTLTEYNDLYSSTIKPLLSQIDDIDIMVGKLEENAYRLDSYTKQLKSRVKEMYESK
nr:biogenesis of lysosome-related organelles complex 1 subunit 2 isoform X2 [Helicoverpa armigera]